MKNSIDLRVAYFLSSTGMGFPEPDGYKTWHITQRFLWIMFIWGVQILFLIEFSLLFVRLCIDYNDFGTVCASLVGGGYIANVVIKILIFKNNSKLFSNLFDEVRQISKELSINPFCNEYILFHDRFYVKIIKIALFKLFVEAVAVFILFSVFIVKGFVVGAPENKLTPAVTWFPYENSEKPQYILSTTFELIIYVNVTLRNTAIDILFWLMLLIPTIQLRYLNRLLTIIMGHKTVPESDDGMDDLEIAAIQPPKNLETNFYWWLKYHRRVIVVIHEFKKISSMYLAGAHLITLFLFALAGLVAISTTTWNIVQQSIVNGIVLSNTLQLYIISLAGDWLDESNERATDGGFSLVLFSANKVLMKDYLFACARAKRALGINFCGNYRLSSENFEGLIRSTITFLVTLVQIRNEDSGPNTQA